ncbi:MAG: hypothetical protein EOM55_00105 [Clostridia bacterium]|nr:hypothetical protein [Clostridia bacterium]
MFEKLIDEKINLLLAEIDSVSMRVKTLENAKKIVIDSELDDASINGIQNGVVTTAINSCAKKDASNLTTEDVESFLDKLQTNSFEEIYDKNSLDNSLNWGYVDGILGGVEVAKTTSFFEAYKGLYIYATCDNVELKLYLDLCKLNLLENNYNGATCGLSGTLNSLMCVKAEVDTTKSKIKCTTMGFFSSSYTSQNGVSSFYIHRIKAVK